MISIKSLFIFIGCSYVLNCSAQKTIDTIATKLGNLAIPIKIYLPKKALRKALFTFLYMVGAGMEELKMKFLQQRFLVM